MNNFSIDSDMETQYTQPDQDTYIEYLLERLEQLITMLKERLNELEQLERHENSQREQQNQNSNIIQGQEDNTANNISTHMLQNHSSNFKSQFNLENPEFEIDLEFDISQNFISFDDEKQSNYSDISIEFIEDDDQQNQSLAQKLSQYQIKGVLKQFTLQKKMSPHNPINIIQ